MKERMKTPTEFHKAFFNDEVSQTFEADFSPSVAVQELGTYLKDFVQKLQTMMA